MANATLEDIIKAIQGTVRKVDGMRSAPDEIQDSANVFPFGSCEPNSGKYIQESAGFDTVLHTVILNIVVARQDAARSYQEIIPYVDRVALALLADTTLGGVVQTFGDLSYVWASFEYGKTVCVGWRFTISNIKVQVIV